jgi:hypothetical protein
MNDLLAAGTSSGNKKRPLPGGPARGDKIQQPAQRLKSLDMLDSRFDFSLEATKTLAKGTRPPSLLAAFDL